jgi:small subunit ribosomal protein S9
MMKPPEEVFPQRKAAEFDETGRPHHSLFYTSKPNFFKFLHDIVSHQLECNKFEDRMIRQQKTPDPALQINLSGTAWLSKDQLEVKLVENIRDIEYNNFVAAMTRLANAPFSYRSKEFIDQYRRPLMDQNITIDIPKPQVDQDGRNFITVYGECSSLLSFNHHKSQ